MDSIFEPLIEDVEEAVEIVVVAVNDGEQTANSTRAALKCRGKAI